MIYRCFYITYYTRSSLLGTVADGESRAREQCIARTWSGAHYTDMLLTPGPGPSAIFVVVRPPPTARARIERPHCRRVISPPRRRRSLLLRRHSTRYRLTGTPPRAVRVASCMKYGLGPTLVYLFIYFFQFLYFCMKL